MLRNGALKYKLILIHPPVHAGLSKAKVKISRREHKGHANSLQLFPFRRVGTVRYISSIVKDILVYGIHSKFELWTAKMQNQPAVLLLLADTYTVNVDFSTDLSMPNKLLDFNLGLRDALLHCTEHKVSSISRVGFKSAWPLTSRRFALRWENPKKERKKQPTFMAFIMHLNIQLFSDKQGNAKTLDKVKDRI